MWDVTFAGSIVIIVRVIFLFFFLFVGVGVIAARGQGGRTTLAELKRSELQVEALVTMKTADDKQDTCQQCKKGFPITRSSDINR